MKIVNNSFVCLASLILSSFVSAQPSSSYSRGLRKLQEKSNSILEREDVDNEERVLQPLSLELNPPVPAPMTPAPTQAPTRAKTSPPTLAPTTSKRNKKNKRKKFSKKKKNKKKNKKRNFTTGKNAGKNGRKKPRRELKDEKAADKDSQRFTSHYMTDLRDIVVLANLKSQRIQVDPTAITLVTQMSLDDTKLQRLLDVASRWTGYISVAVYVQPKTFASGTAYLEDSIQILDEFRSKNSPGLNMTRFHLIVDGRGESSSNYPHNYLRNVAMDNAPTDLVLVTDIDFIPSLGSHDSLKVHFETSPYLQGDRDLLVLPAFERRSSEGESELTVTASDLPSTKKELLQIMDEKPDLYQQFHHFFDSGHGPTNYSRWYDATEPYTINYALNYEPYFVVRRGVDLPPFWEHFTGFGRNKETWVEELALAGYNFRVSPESFLIHINHDYKKQDARVVRPFVIDEYTKNFQTYLKRTYNNSFWDDTILDTWNLNQKRNYAKKMFRFCTDASITFEGTKSNLTLGYQCNGTAYNNFTRNMQEFVADLPQPFGRRLFPIQDNATVLVIGNSHTRQMVHTLVCQFKDKVKEYDDVMGFSSKRTDAFKVRFQNNATLISLTNCPLVYSKHWKTLVESVIERKLESLDAIVVGKFNSYAESLGTAFMDTISQAAKGNSDIDFAKITAPDLDDFAAVYSGSLVYVSMFATQGDGPLNQSIKTMEFEKLNRTNIAVIDGRKYIRMMGFECGSDGFKTVEKCHEPADNARNARPAEQMHRCVGANGGHPDLIAWEVTEKLNTLHY